MHELPSLPYAYNALEPHIDEQTVKLHHDLHHAGYVKGLNTAEEKLAEARKTGDYALIKHWLREKAFHGSGHILHTIYWESMGPKTGGKPSGALLKQIEKQWGSFEVFQKEFSAATIGVEASGWGALCVSHDKNELVILQAEKHQDLTMWGVQVVMVCDVWEHAYYLKYTNKRADYVAAFWNVVNWKEVQKKFDHFMK